MDSSNDRHFLGVLAIIFGSLWDKFIPTQNIEIAVV